MPLHNLPSDNGVAKNNAKPAPTRQNTPARKRQNRHSQIACLFPTQEKPLTKLQTASFAQQKLPSEMLPVEKPLQSNKIPHV